MKPTEIYKNIKDSIVFLNLMGFDNQQVGTASGVIIKKEKDVCYIVTNFHVLKDVEKIEFKHNGIKISDDCIEILDTDRELDLLLLSVKGYHYNSIKCIDNSDDLLIGETVYAIGSPEEYENTFSNGIISGLRKNGKKSRIQTTASIAKGSSGGALVNELGLLVGITVGGHDKGNLNFAIPINEVNSFLTDSFKTTYPSYYANNFIIGINAMESCEYPKAIEFLNMCDFKYIEDIDFKADLYSSLGDCYYYIDEIKTAIELYTKSIDTFPSYYNYIQRGRIYEEHQKFKEALEDYNSSLKSDPKNLNGHLYKAKLLIKLNENEKAVKKLKYLIDQTENYQCQLEANFILGLFYRKNKKYSKSIIFLQKAVDIYEELFSSDPTNYYSGANYYFELSFAFYLNKKHWDVITNLTKVTDLTPDNPLPFLIIGICFWRYKAFDYAIYNFTECLNKSYNCDDSIFKSEFENINNFNIDFHSKLGIADSYYRGSDIDEALRIIEDLQDEYPNYLETYIVKAQLFLRNNNPQEALKNYEYAFKNLDKSEPFLFYSEFDKKTIKNEINNINLNNHG